MNLCVKHTVLALLFSLSIYGQQPYLFAHTDKDIYTGNEMVWFTAYLCNVTSLKQRTALYVVLADPIKKKPVMEKRFWMQDGLGHGYLQLPDSLPAGEYQFMTYTNKLFCDTKEPVFRKWISVRSMTARPFVVRVAGLAEPGMQVPVNTKVSLVSDASGYNCRSKTKWKVLITDVENKPVRALFSVAAVRNTRLAVQEPDILAYSMQKKAVLNGVGMTCMEPIEGWVTYAGKPLKQPMQLSLLSAQHFNMLKTDSIGKFVIEPAKLKGTYGAKYLLSIVDKKRQELYRLEVKENENVMNNQLALAGFPYMNNANTKNQDVFTAEEVYEQGKQLMQVDIKAARIPDYKRPEYYQLPVMEGPCAAWICDCGHWKCKGCLPLRNPVKGSSYLDQHTGRFVKYAGCPEDTVVKPFMKVLQPTLLPVPFPEIDYSKEHSDKFNGHTTLYWNYVVMTNEHGEAEFSFYTNDLKGPFTVIVQGISEAGPFSETKEFRVGI